jgi:hypothetical protein
VPFVFASGRQYSAVLNLPSSEDEDRPVVVAREEHEERFAPPGADSWLA